MRRALQRALTGVAAQLVIAPVARADIREVDELPSTARGEGGFGSTGR